MRETFTVNLIPKNVHLKYNIGRREARARVLLQAVSRHPSKVSFVDASQYGLADHYAVVSVDHEGKLLNSASANNVSASLAEQVAVAIAMIEPTRTNIYTDSRFAARAFASG